MSTKALLHLAHSVNPSSVVSLSSNQHSSFPVPIGVPSSSSSLSRLRPPPISVRAHYLSEHMSSECKRRSPHLQDMEIDNEFIARGVIEVVENELKNSIQIITVRRRHMNAFRSLEGILYFLRFTNSQWLECSDRGLLQDVLYLFDACWLSTLEGLQSKRQLSAHHVTNIKEVLEQVLAFAKEMEQRWAGQEQVELQSIMGMGQVRKERVDVVKAIGPIAATVMSAEDCSRLELKRLDLMSLRERQEATEESGKLHLQDRLARWMEQHRGMGGTAYDLTCWSYEQRYPYLLSTRNRVAQGATHATPGPNGAAPHIATAATPAISTSFSTAAASTSPRALAVTTVTTSSSSSSTAAAAALPVPVAPLTAPLSGGAPMKSEKDDVRDGMPRVALHSTAIRPSASNTSISTAGQLPALTLPARPPAVPISPIPASSTIQPQLDATPIEVNSQWAELGGDKGGAGGDGGGGRGGGGGGGAGRGSSLPPPSSPSYHLHSTMTSSSFLYTPSGSSSLFGASLMAPPSYFYSPQIVQTQSGPALMSTHTTFQDTAQHLAQTQPPLSSSSMQQQPSPQTSFTLPVQPSVLPPWSTASSSSFSPTLLFQLQQLQQQQQQIRDIQQAQATAQVQAQAQAQIQAQVQAQAQMQAQLFSMQQQHQQQQQQTRPQPQALQQSAPRMPTFSNHTDLSSLLSVQSMYPQPMPHSSTPPSLYSTFMQNPSLMHPSALQPNIPSSLSSFQAPPPPHLQSSSMPQSLSSFSPSSSSLSSLPSQSSMFHRLPTAPSGLPPPSG